MRMLDCPQAVAEMLLVYSCKRACELPRAHINSSDILDARAERFRGSCRAQRHREPSVVLDY